MSTWNSYCNILSFFYSPKYTRYNRLKDILDEYHKNWLIQEHSKTNKTMKKIIFKQEKEVQEGDVVEIKGVTIEVNKFTIMNNPEYFEVMMDEKEHLLQEAKKKYPVGTVHRGYYGNREFIVNREPSWSVHGDQPAIFGGGAGVIYRDGKWSEIVQPKKYILTTEDGVDKYEGDKMYAVRKDDLEFGGDKSYCGNWPNKFYYFDNPDKAEKFIKEEKERREEEENMDNLLELSRRIEITPDYRIRYDSLLAISKKYKVTKRRNPSIN